MFSLEALEIIWENLKLEFHFNNCYDDAVIEPIDEIHVKKQRKNAWKVQTATKDMRGFNQLRMS